MKAYKYLFYKFYKFWETISYPRVWSDFKASLTLDVLVFFILFSLMIYFNIFINPYVNFGKYPYVIIASILMIGAFNYTIFNYQDRWKKIVSDFDGLKLKKNKRDSLIVGFVVVMILSNLFFAFYLMSQINWKLYH